jgi:hypothetical protein
MPRSTRYAGVILLAAATAVAAGVANKASEKPTVPLEQPTEGQTRPCPGCNETIPVTAVFCPKCGRYLPDAKPETIACPSCGAVIPAAKINCPKCGGYTKMTGAPETAATVGTTPAESSPTTPAAAPPKTPKSPQIHGIVRGAAMTYEGSKCGGGWVALGGLTKDKLLIACGLGYQSYPNASSVPLFITARFDFAPWTIAPGLFFDGGYNICKLKSPSLDASGLCFGCGLSLNIHTGKAAGLCLDAGAKYEMSKKYYYYLYPNGAVLGPYESSTGYLLYTGGAGLFF